MSFDRLCNFQVVRRWDESVAKTKGKDMTIYCGLAPKDNGISYFEGNIEDHRIVCDTRKCPMYQTWKIAKEKLTLA
jgi:hypothetical protein